MNTVRDLYKESLGHEKEALERLFFSLFFIPRVVEMRIVYHIFREIKFLSSTFYFLGHIGFPHHTYVLHTSFNSAWFFARNISFKNRASIWGSWVVLVRASDNIFCNVFIFAMLVGVTIESLIWRWSPDTVNGFSQSRIDFFLVSFINSPITKWTKFIRAIAFFMFFLFTSDSRKIGLELFSLSRTRCTVRGYSFVVSQWLRVIFPVERSIFDVWPYDEVESIFPWISISRFLFALLAASGFPVPSSCVQKSTPIHFSGVARVFLSISSLRAITSCWVIETKASWLSHCIVNLSSFPSTHLRVFWESVFWTLAPYAIT